MRVGTQATAVLFTIVLARRLGQVGLGEYAFVASAVLLANVLTTFGTDMLLIREIAARGALSHIPGAFIIQLVLSIVLIALTFALAPALPNQSRAVVVGLQIYSIALLPLAAFSVFTAALRGVGRMGLYAALNLAAAVAQLGAVLLLVPAGASVVTVAVLLVITQVFAALLGAAACSAGIAHFWASWRTPAAGVWPLARRSSRIALLGALGMLYQRTSVYMLATLTGPGPTGWFAAAQRPVEASKVAHLATFGALYPAFARSADDATGARASATFTLSLRALLAIAALAALGLSLFADPLVRVLFGPGFEPSVPALKVMGWVLIPYTLSAYLSLRLVATRRERPVAVALAVSLVSLVVLSAWWIPLGGIVGACWAALAAESLQAALLAKAHGLPDLS